MECAIIVVAHENSEMGVPEDVLIKMLINFFITVYYASKATLNMLFQYSFSALTLIRQKEGHAARYKCPSSP